jgi:DNA invertase Pin-like site-specific DNA recombinase
VTDGTQVLGYIRVSTDEQATSRLGLNAQRVAIAQACVERGWELVEVIEDAGYSAKDLNRPGIQHALTMLEGRQPQAQALVVAKLDRLTRSLLDFAGIMERARKKGWSLAALDLGVDTTTPAGEMVANVMATFAQFERHLIGERTKAALAIKKAEGVKLGRPRTLPDATRARVKRMRGRGMTLAAIAANLNRDEVPTAHGGQRWYASTVRTVLNGC